MTEFGNLMADAITKANNNIYNRQWKLKSSGELGRFCRDGGPQTENKKMNRSFLGSHRFLLIYGMLKQAGEGQNQI